jgi:hypothetical protein
MWITLVSYYRWQLRVTIRGLVLFRLLPVGMARILLGGLGPPSAHRAGVANR